MQHIFPRPIDDEKSNVREGLLETFLIQKILNNIKLN